MKIWIIKHKGATWFGNFMHNVTMEIIPTARQEPYKMYAQYCFYRRKDAVKYLKANYPENIDLFQVVGATLPKSKQDNRKTR